MYQKSEICHAIFWTEKNAGEKKKTPFSVLSVQYRTLGRQCLHKTRANLCGWTLCASSSWYERGFRLLKNLYRHTLYGSDKVFYETKLIQSNDNSIAPLIFGLEKFNEFVGSEACFAAKEADK